MSLQVHRFESFDLSYMSRATSQETRKVRVFDINNTPACLSASWRSPLPLPFVSCQLPADLIKQTTYHLPSARFTGKPRTTVHLHLATDGIGSEIHQDKKKREVSHFMSILKRK